MYMGIMGIGWHPLEDGQPPMGYTFGETDSVSLCQLTVSLQCEVKGMWEESKLEGEIK